MKGTNPTGTRALLQAEAKGLCANKQEQDMRMLFGRAGADVATVAVVVVAVAATVTAAGTKNTTDRNLNERWQVGGSVEQRSKTICNKERRCSGDL